MHYELRELEVTALPERLVLAPGASGLGILLRDRGRLVGFKMIARSKFGAAGALDPKQLIDADVREAAAIERLRDEMGPPSDPAPTFTVAICCKDR